MEVDPTTPPLPPNPGWGGGAADAEKSDRLVAVSQRQEAVAC